MDDQRVLFPLGDDDLPESPGRFDRPEQRSITPGDWLSIEYDGKTVVGMIYRCQDEAYTFVYWDNRILRFGTTTRDRIGRWDELLTAQFRGQIAVIPNYVEKCIAAWVMQPEQLVRAKSAGHVGNQGRASQSRGNCDFSQNEVYNRTRACELKARASKLINEPVRIFVSEVKGMLFAC